MGAEGAVTRVGLSERDLRAEGNDAFRKGAYAAAARLYGEALDLLGCGEGAARDTEEEARGATDPTERAAAVRRETLEVDHLRAEIAKGE